MPISVETGRTMIFTRTTTLVLFFCVTNTWAHSHVDFKSYNLNEGDHEIKSLDDSDVYLTLFKNYQREHEKVRIQLYYSSFSMPCENFVTFDFNPVLQIMSPYLDIQTYPFGNAKVIDHNGKLDFICHHGPKECYGNKLHACALDKLQHTTALTYNNCLMKRGDQVGSNDERADRCGKSMDIDSEPIKECAKGIRGTELLLYYGEESKKANFSYVPHVLINGKMPNTEDLIFKKHVCDAFTNPPPPCTNDKMY